MSLGRTLAYAGGLLTWGLTGWAAGLHFRSDTSLVLINAAVYDKGDRFVPDLKPADFRLFDGGRERRIVSFAVESAPVSTCIVFDLSQSMKSALAMSREALKAFLDSAGPEDEFCIMGVRDRPLMLLDFTPDGGTLLAHSAMEPAGGLTALLDSVYMAASHMKRAANRRRALLVISDGEDNHSRYMEQDLLGLLRELDVTVYSIGCGVRWRPEGSDGASLLNDMASLTGGRYFEAYHPADLPKIMGQLAIRNQYVLGFAPGPTRDGKYHRVEVKLAGREELRKLRAVARPGYFAPGGFFVQ